MTGRWSDLIDMAAKSAGLPYPSYAEIDYVLWEWTCYPMGTSEEVWRQALAYFRGEVTAPYPGPPCPSAASAAGVTGGSTGARPAAS